MDKNTWLCQEHYDNLCIMKGYEIPIFTIANFSTLCFCGTMAEHLVRLSEEDVNKLKEESIERG
jgi:hypothetical protein